MKYNIIKTAKNLFYQELFDIYDKADKVLSLESFLSFIRYNKNLTSDCKIVLAMTGHNVVGFLVYWINVYNIPDIYMIGVGKTFRHQNIGTTMFLIAAQDLVSMGYNQACYPCLPENKGSISFCEKLGARIFSYRAVNFRKLIGEDFLQNVLTPMITQKIYLFDNLKQIINEKWALLENSNIHIL